MKKTTPKNDLFLLIKSLTKSEKRYFKLLYNPDEDNKYIQLFDLIDSQEKYNEEEIKTYFKNQAIVNNFHVAKKYLTDRILKSLQLFNYNNTVEAKIRNMLDYAEIYQSRGLHSICFKLLKRAEKFANENELFSYQIEIINLKRANLLNLHHKRYESEDIETMNLNNQKALKEIENQNFYLNNITNLFTEYVRWKNIKKTEKNKVFEAIKNDSKFTNEDSVSNFLSLITLYNLKGYYYHEQEEYNMSKQYRIQIMDLIKSNKERKKKYNKNYIIAFFNYLTDLMALKNFDLLKKEIENFDKITTLNIDEYVEKVKRSFLLKVQLHLMELDKQKINLSFQEFNVFSKKYSKELNRGTKRLILFYFGRCYFKTKQFEAALDIFIDICNKPKSEREIGIYSMSYFWYIITHFELGNYSVLPYLSKSAIRFLKKHKIYFKIDQLFLNFFSKEKNFMKNNFNQNIKTLTQSMQKELMNIHDVNQNFISITDWFNQKMKVSN